MSEKKSYGESLPGDRINPDHHPQISETDSPPTYESVDLLKGAREILIRHQGEVYRLRLTRNGKLILNK